LEESTTSVDYVSTSGASATAQFVMHHADSLIVERAHASLRHADVVTMDTKVHRKLR
jgi:hypothetical protein